MSDIQGLGQYISAIVRDSTSSLQQMNEIAKRLQISINEAQRLAQGTAQSSFQQLMGQLNAAVQHLASAAPFVERAAATGKTWIQTHVSGASGGSTSGGGSSNGGSPSDGGTSGSATGSGDAPSNAGSGRTHTFHFIPQSERIKAELKKNGVEHRPIQPFDGIFNRIRTSDEIIERLGGGDQTDGSCSSLAFAYAGNIAGYDVLDFRDGESREYFSKNSSLEKIANLPGIDSKIIRGKDDFDCSHKIFDSMIEGKEYYFATAEHAAVIRRIDNCIEYLELQDPDKNGWYSLDDNSLKKRFNCVDNNTFEPPNFLIDIESLGKSPDFLDILGFINTAETEQHKGVDGDVK